MPPEPSDETLVGRVAGGDLAAFSQLYDRYARAVYAMAAHLLGPAEAEDAVQEVFLRLWRSGDRFDEQRGRFVAWFLAIARHEVRGRLRRRTREQRLALAEDVDRLLAAAPAPVVDLDEQLWRQESGELVWQALNTLPPEQRQVLVLAYFGDLSQSMIAESLGWPLGTVKKRVRLGLQKLRRALAPRELAAGGNGSARADAPIGLVRPHSQVSVDDGS